MRRLLLIVEDHDATRSALRRAFTRKGWAVAEAATVAEGIDRIAQSPAPDCLILDLMLPDGDGEAVLRKVRELRLKTRVAVCSGTSDHSRMALVQALGPEVTMQKPVDLAQIYRFCQTT